MADLLKAEPELARKLGQLTSIPNIGLTTAIVIVGVAQTLEPKVSVMKIGVDRYLKKRLF